MFFARYSSHQCHAMWLIMMAQFTSIWFLQQISRTRWQALNIHQFQQPKACFDRLPIVEPMSVQTSNSFMVWLGYVKFTNKPTDHVYQQNYPYNFAHFTSLFWLGLGCREVPARIKPTLVSDVHSVVHGLIEGEMQQIFIFLENIWGSAREGSVGQG
jgi:hypothetical protein